jgi:uncharacterized alkaline shock family protein YloU
MSTAYDVATQVLSADSSHDVDHSAGDLKIAERVIEKIASQAVLEVGPATGEPRAVLGVNLAGFSGAATPQVSADVFGREAVIQVRCGVVYPEPVGAVTQRVREHVRRKVHDLTGIRVHEVDVEVVALRRLAAARRVE